MITPLMVLMSATDTDTFKLGPPIELRYLNRQDSTILNSEISRIGEKLVDPMVVDVDEDDRVSTIQYLGGEVKSISPYTAIVLDRAKRGYHFWIHSRNAARSNASEELVDLGDDDVINWIEHYPPYAYRFVYNVMTHENSLSFENKIAKIKRVLDAIEKHISSVSRGPEVASSVKDAILRLSCLDFWQQLLYSDYCERFEDCPPVVTLDTLDTIGAEIREFGIYGFENPYQMYKEFSTSRVPRKTTVVIPSDIIDYLRKVVIGGTV